MNKNKKKSQLIIVLSTVQCGRNVRSRRVYIIYKNWKKNQRQWNKRKILKEVVADEALNPYPGVGILSCQWILKLYCLRFDVIRSHRLTARGSGWQFDHDISLKWGYGVDVVVASTCMAVENSWEKSCLLLFIERLLFELKWPWLTTLFPFVIWPEAACAFGIELSKILKQGIEACAVQDLATGECTLDGIWTIIGDFPVSLNPDIGE